MNHPEQPGEVEDWFTFEQHGRTEVTLFNLAGVSARTGARGTRFFKKQVRERPDAKQVVLRALELMREWPAGTWPCPAGLRPEEEPIVLPALQRAVGQNPSAPTDWRT